MDRTPRHQHHRILRLAEDICRAFAGLQQLTAQPQLAPLGPILAASNGGLGLNPAKWPTVWFKGGGEPGVLTVGWLAANSKGQTFVVVGMLSDPAAAAPGSTSPRWRRWGVKWTMTTPGR